MIRDGQVRKLRQLLAAGERLAVAARRTGMDEKTARKYRDSDRLPSADLQPRTWRTRLDPFQEVWEEVQARLEAEPRLRAFALFAWLQEKYPGRFLEGQRRTFQRRVRAWRAIRGPRQEVMFRPTH